MRYIYVILTALILSSACNAESSPNTPPAVALPASPNTPPAAQPTPPPTTIQPTTSNFDEAIRIARAELERDAYKQALQENQKSVDNTKWMITSDLAAIGLVLTAIGIILAAFGFVAFKNNIVRVNL